MLSQSFIKKKPWAMLSRTIILLNERNFSLNFRNYFVSVPNQGIVTGTSLIQACNLE